MKELNRNELQQTDFSENHNSFIMMMLMLMMKAITIIYENRTLMTFKCVRFSWCIYRPSDLVR